jgi:hypothetical protein
MIRSTHKTIQDYLNPAMGPSKREQALPSGSSSFRSVLEGALNKPPAAQNTERAGLTIQDYMNRRIGAIASAASSLAMAIKRLPGNTGQSRGVRVG